MEMRKDEKIESRELSYLDFVPVGERAYMLFIKRTGRFHNAELGIDFFPAKKVEIVAGGDENDY
jgi:hypothetical protein